MFFNRKSNFTFFRFGKLIVIILFFAAGISNYIPLYLQIKASEIKIQKEKIFLIADPVIRTLNTADGNLSSTSFKLDNNELLQVSAEEFSFTVRFAEPNRKPIGIKPGESGMEPISPKEMKFPMILLEKKNEVYLDTKGVEWINPIRINAKNWNQHFEYMHTQIYSPSSGITRLQVIAHSTKGELNGLKCTLNYEVYDGYPVVRKWISIANHGKKWLKIDELQIEDLELSPKFRNQTPLAPGAYEFEGKPMEWVAGPSIASFGTEDGSIGVIASSEIPSAMREINNNGSMGYRKELFEWVLGPSEKFTSEPVFYYGYIGKTWETVSAVSTPRNRAVERPYRDFLSQHVGIAADEVKLYAPLWSIWEATWRNPTHEIVKKQAKIAARCGFKQFEIDAGWQWDNLGTRIDKEKFPDFLETCRFVRSLGLEISLWVSNYRSEGSRDLKLMPDARAVPLRIKSRKLGPGYGMSYCSPWKYYFARDLACLHHQYGIIGYKEDHINIRAGDIGLGHESRTRKESLLRGFRGLFEVQDMIHNIAPEVCTEISHENYWDNPSLSCDIAALKHSVYYHIPPNTHYGGEDFFLKAKGKEPKDTYYGGEDSESAGTDARRKALIKGCKTAREQIYAHRALPLRCLHFYALITINHNGSLTPLIQDRQVCSILMGAPYLFSGDLTTLTEENIEHYAKRFKLINELQEEYSIYKHFQYSGVPPPTDSGWHWWGKLNEDGYGAVVILRGSDGERERTINIPWVEKESKYKVRACFAEEDLGTFTGEELHKGAIKLTLPNYGQEILKVYPE